MDRAILLLGISVLLSSSPAAGADQDLRRKVLIISVDGTRPDALIAANAPNLDGLFVDAAYSYRGQTAGGPTDLPISGASYSSMLSGVWCAKHGVCENDFSHSHFDLYPIFFCRLRAARPSVVLESIVRWGPLSPNLIACADVNLAPASDAAATQEGIRLLRDTDPDVLFFHIEDVDTAGHNYGFSPTVPAYLAAIETADGRVGEVLQALRARPTYAQEDWLIIALTDHGGSGKDHHTRIPESMTIFMTLNGRRAAPGEMDPPPEVVDVAATAMTYLGLPIDPAWGLNGHPVGLKPETPVPRQLPADCNQDGLFNVADVVCLLILLFSRDPVAPPCGEGTMEGASRVLLDSNGDGGVDISDALFVLFSLFGNGPPPAAGKDCAPLEGCPDACAP